MKSAGYPEPVNALVAELRKLPGVGPRSASRIALGLLSGPRERMRRLAAALADAQEKVRTCERCGYFSTEALCEICRNPERDRSLLCVVETAMDIFTMEKSGVYRGLYHALGGRLAPLEDVGPEELRIAQLLDRLERETPAEIILALSADVEGEATAVFLAEKLRDHEARVTRIAQGLPAGGGLEMADEVTLSRALGDRRTVEVE